MISLSDPQTAQCRDAAIDPRRQFGIGDARSSGRDRVNPGSGAVQLRPQALHLLDEISDQGGEFLVGVEVAL